MKVCIVGYPGTGKTTLGRQVSHATGMPLLETDDLIHGVRWDEQPRLAMDWIVAHPEHVIEGVLAARLLDKGYCPDIVLVTTVEHEVHHRVNGLRTRIDRALAGWRGEVVRLKY